MAMSSKSHKRLNSEVVKTRRDFFDGIALVAILPVLVVIYMSITVETASGVNMLASNLIVSMFTLLLGMLGVLVLWRYCWATVELRLYLNTLVDCDCAKETVGAAPRRNAPWGLKSVLDYIVSEQRKRMYELEVEKAAIERRNLLANY